jgi:hypothetical protein
LTTEEAESLESKQISMKMRAVRITEPAKDDRNSQKIARAAERAQIEIKLTTEAQANPTWKKHSLCSCTPLGRHLTYFARS